ncbi:MAG TPA: aminotransferase class I/II-fold pyridoxal phosphate-dependent enzyme, partial [Spirochaetes bacterium]|nr:aminotransferase class I/II-fold pyridoxal phosphate-dependent enzyme [Spirochaetota bacterium]
MMPKAFEVLLRDEISSKRLDGSYKSERIIITAQDSEIQTEESGKTLLNFCSNNYLGLSNHPDVKMAAQKAIESHGFGMSSVRFICGTQDLHKDLENRLSRFLLKEDTILYNSCFDANGGLFQNLLGSDDVILSASLNHASIIDGVRLSKAKKMLYHYDDVNELNDRLKEAHESRFKVVVTDGVFSMEGELASLDKIVQVCQDHEALLVVDDSHATGFIGDHGRGTAEYFGVHDQVDLFTGTLGKALGGATGGYISGKREIIE